MIQILRIPPLVDPLSGVRRYTYMFDEDPSWEGMTALWEIVLAIALGDNAVSLYYHPWSGRDLSYEANCIRYQMVPPDESIAKRFPAAAASMVGIPGWRAATRRWFRRPVQGATQVRLVADSGSSDWLVVIWSAEGKDGVDWYRIGSLSQQEERG